MCQEKKQTYRCNNCFAIFVTTEKFDYNARYTAKCSICEQVGCDYMGQVGLDMALTKDELACKCDDRCTAAAGPKCSCQCGGVNHQSFQNGYTMVTRELGVIKLTCTDEKTVAKHKKIFNDFNAAKIAACERRDANPLHKKYIEKVRLPYAEWCFVLKEVKKFSKAFNAKSQASRLKTLNSCFAPE